MQTITHLRLWVTAFLLAGGTSACAQSPVSQGWGIGMDASRAMGGHAVVQLEHAQSSELLWQVAAGRYVGTEIGMTPFWKGLKGEVISGSVMSLGTLVFPQQDHKLGASWFLGVDVSRESYRIQRSTEDTQLLSGATSGVALQTREEARLLAGAQWSVGSHLAVRVHVGMGAVRERLSSRFVGEEVSSLPMARPGGVALIWRW